MRHNKLHEHNYRYPWQASNQFTLLVDGPEFFSAMLDSIHRAQHYILLEMYLVQPGHVSQHFFQALEAAAKRGVDIYVLFDDYGSRLLTQADKNKLLENDIHLSFYNPLHFNRHKLMIFRDHRKLLVVDGLTAYVGGVGLIDEFDSSEYPQNNWRENAVKVQGTNVGQWQDLFIATWRQWSDTPINITYNKEIMGEQLGRVAMTQGPQFLEIKRSFINHIRNSQRRVWMCTAYFAPSRKLRRALRRAALRGIDVRILIPGPITDHPMARYIAQRYYSSMLGDGIRIYEYQPRFLHAKLVICDDWVSLGSCNIDRWNLRWNLDANQEINNREFSSSVVQMFENDFSNSKEITQENWNKRSFYRKLKIYFWSYAIRFADNILLRLKLIRHWKNIRHHRK